jgi:hypothetical protein
MKMIVMASKKKPIFTKNVSKEIAKIKDMFRVIDHWEVLKTECEMFNDLEKDYLWDRLIRECEQTLIALYHRLEKSVKSLFYEDEPFSEIGSMFEKKTIC